MANPIELMVNGRKRSTQSDPDTPLLAFLRDELRLTGSKYGCGEGQCGACTVLLDGVGRRSCITPVSAAVGKSITTIEGLEQSGRLHPVQQAFLDAEAFQCAYCTLMSRHDERMFDWVRKFNPYDLYLRLRTPKYQSHPSLLRRSRRRVFPGTDRLVSNRG
jgi:hypothetical protein